MIREYAFSQYTVNGTVYTRCKKCSLLGLLHTIKRTNLLKQGDESVYQISIKITKSDADYREWPFSKHREIYSFYIANKVYTDTELSCSIQKMYGDDIYEMPDVVGKPAILTDIGDVEHILGGIHRNNISSGRLRSFYRSSGIRPSRGARAYGGYGPRKVSVGKKINWHVLNPTKDIVVDQDLHQIYPIKTKNYLALIHKILEKQHQ